MFKFQRRTTEKAPIASKEYSQSNFIPYYCHWDGNTILTKKSELIQILKISGYSFETADDEDLDTCKAVRNTLLKSMSSGNYALWFHLVRCKQSAFADGEIPPGFASEVNEKWREKHASHEAFVNDLYVSIIRKSDKKGFAYVEYLINSLMNKADKSNLEEQMRESHKEINDISSRFLATLREYKPKLLGLKVTEFGTYSEPLEFLSGIVNCGIFTPMLVPSRNIAEYLPTHRLYFGPRAIEVRESTEKTKFAAIVSVKEYNVSTAASMMDSFLQLPFEFIMSQSYEFTSRNFAVQSMKIHQKRMAQTNDVAVSQVEEISKALDDAMSGHVGFGSHHITFLCMENSLKQLDEAVSQISGELVNLGMIPVREKMNLEAAYWSQLPGNFDYVARKATINTLNMASFASLHNYPVGKKSGNHWGPAVTVFDTSSGTPYYFNFHQRDVGHTTIIGPTGSGKTVLMNFLCAQAQKFGGRLFFFDKDRGAEIFIRAIGGIYTVIEPGTESNFNPLQLEDTSDNRSFLVDWFRSLVTTFEGEFKAEDMDVINSAINGNFKLAFENRNLTNVAPFFGLEGPGTIAGRLKVWHGHESHSRLFDNKFDSLDLKKHKVFGFEMGHVLKDKISLAPVLLYLFHKIAEALDGTPTMIVLDEAWALIDNPIFAPKIKDWLKTLRKLNAMVIFATQSVEDASKSNISDTLIQQTATQIFLPNPKATEEYRKVFMLSDREFQLIKTTPPSTRYFLLKQSSDIVVARIDLSNMPEIVHVLSGRAETVKMLDEIREQVGDDPKIWLPVFYEQVKQL